MVANGELSDRFANILHLSRNFAAEDPPLGVSDTREETPYEWVGSAAVTVCLVDRRGVDLDEDLVVLRRRAPDFLESQDVRRAVPIVDDCSHRISPRARRDASADHHSPSSKAMQQQRYYAQADGSAFRAGFSRPRGGWLCLRASTEPRPRCPPPSCGRSHDGIRRATGQLPLID